MVEGEERWQTVGSIRDTNVCLSRIAFAIEMGRRWFAYYQLEKLCHRNGNYMKKLTESQVRALRKLNNMKDQEIDLTDIPPLQNWDQAVIGKFYRPIKKSLTIRVDADVLAHFQSSGKGYQTRINRILREAVQNMGTQKQR